MKRLILSLCVLAIYLCIPSALLTPAWAEIIPKCQWLSEKYSKYYVTKRSNVRDAPNTNGRILATLLPGSVVYTNEGTRSFPKNIQGWYVLLATNSLPPPFSGCRGGYIHPDLVSKTPPLQADDSRPSFPLEQARRAVWRMHNPEAPLGHYHSGTATFIAPRIAVTNYHVLMDTLTHTPLQEIAFSQEGTDKILRIRRVLVVSSVYDLALFETTTASHGYLELAEGDEISLNHLSQLTLLGYPKGRFRMMKQMDQTQVVYENAWTFSIALDALSDYRSKDSAGGSGGPIPNARGQVVGIVAQATYNMIHGVKLRHLKDLILINTIGKHDKFTRCTDLRDLFHRVKAETRKLHDMADQGYVLAQYRLTKIYGGRHKIAWMRRAAENGFAPASIDYAYHLLDGTSNDVQKDRAFRFALRVAKQNFATGQLKVAKMLLEGEGTPKNEAMAINWLERAAAQGLNTALEALNRR